MDSLSPAAIALLLVAAFLAGLIDSIAGGGGLITLPSFLAVGLPPHFALGTNKGQAVFGAVTSATSFYKRGEVHRERIGVAFASGFAGSMAGASLLLAVPSEPLKSVVLALLIGVAVLLSRRGRLEPVARDLRHPQAVLAGVAFGMGAYDGFFGPGVGSMLIVAFALVFGDSLTRASGNAKIVNLASNLAATALFSYRGTVLWSLALPMAASNTVGAFIGSRMAVKRGDGFVRRVVLAVVSALVVKIGWDILRPIS